MGLFGKKATCSICNNLESKYKIKDGDVCTSCWQKATGFLPYKSPKEIAINEVLKAMQDKELNEARKSQFNPSKKLGKHMSVDEGHQFWRLENSDRIHTYDEIIDFELIEDGESITKGGLGSAVAGGILFGGVGAIVGGVTGGKKTKSVINKLEIRLTLNNMNCPSLTIYLLSGATEKSSFKYKNALSSAQQILSVLSLMTTTVQNVEQNHSETTTNVTDEIKKFKELMDEGIITEEEFQMKKRQLLGL